MRGTISVVPEHIVDVRIIDRGFKEIELRVLTGDTHDQRAFGEEGTYRSRFLQLILSRLSTRHRLWRLYRACVFRRLQPSFLSTGFPTLAAEADRKHWLAPGVIYCAMTARANMSE
jgi:hypothetical protein